MIKSNTKKKQGFTLIEFAIVILIIGLIVAGVVAGQNLVKEAKIRSIITDINKYRVAVNSFKLLYHGLPGDITNASTQWPSCDGTPANCNGNGDKKVTRGAAANTNEAMRAWQSLSLAEMIGGTFTGTGGGTGNQADAGVNVPNTSITGGGVSFFYETDSYAGNIPNAHVFTIGLVYPDNEVRGAIFTSAEMSNMDRKIDDNIPTKGNVWGGLGRSADNTSWLLCRSSAIAYNVSLAGVSCSPTFFLQ